MSKILVTGGAGFIGSHTCVEFLESGYEVVVLDNLSNSKEEAIRRIEKITGKQVVFYKADMRDETAVRKAQENRKMNEMKHELHEGGCPGSRMMQFKQSMTEDAAVSTGKTVSRLAQWPCQIKLVPTQAAFFDGAKLLIAADCTAYAYANMHEAFMRGKITVIGCPKLDGVDYTDKLTEIIRSNDIKSVTIVRMEVPCCGGLQRAAENALRNSGKFIPWQVVTISRDGNILD